MHLLTLPGNCTKRNFYDIIMCTQSLNKIPPPQIIENNLKSKDLFLVQNFVHTRNLYHFNDTQEIESWISGKENWKHSGRFIEI